MLMIIQVSVNYLVLVVLANNNMRRCSGRLRDHRDKIDTEAGDDTQSQAPFCVLLPFRIPLRRASANPKA